jgi:replicative DNA helicase
MTIPGIEEEEAVLGAILTQGSTYQEAAVIIKETDFYNEQHRLVWRAMTELNNLGKPIDPVAVSTILREHKCLTRAGGPSFISGLVDVLCDVSNIKYYAEAVNSAARGRELKRLGRRLMDDDIPPHQRLDIAYTETSEINERATIGKSSTVGEVSSQIVSDIVDGDGFSGGIKTGFYNLDDPLNGLQKKHLIILGARPSTGKSAMALQIAAHVAGQGGHVAFFSPEMTDFQLNMRLLSLKSGIPYKKLDRGNKLKEDDQDALRDALNTIKLLNITIDDSSAQTTTRIKLKSRQYATSPRGLSLIIIDYLQLLCEGDDDKASVTKISRELKAMAKDLNVPVLACSQIRRRYGQEPRRPNKSMLKGSGQQEQDADSVILLWYPEKGNKQKVEAFIDKNRHGGLGQAMLYFDKETTRFEEHEGGW